MNFRFWKYFQGFGITGTLFRVPALLFLLVYWGLALLGVLAIAALIYAVI